MAGDTFTAELIRAKLYQTVERDHVDMVDQLLAVSRRQAGKRGGELGKSEPGNHSEYFAIRRTSSLRTSKVSEGYEDAD